MGSGEFAQAIDQKILRFIRQSFPDHPSDESFNQLALEIFAYQFEHNTTYRMFCIQRRATPDRIDCWEGIPAAPVGAFKSGAFSCFDPRMAVRIFETSGTTAGIPGRHYFDTLALYDEAALPNFSRHVLPDAISIPMRMLMPTPEDSPRSSLVYMCQIVSDAFSNDTKWYIQNGRLNTDGLASDLEISADTQTPRLLMGTTFSFIHFFADLESSRQKVSMPKGSRIMETGGTKGRAREIPREQFLRQAADLLGIEAIGIVNEYGMTELTSQMYDDSLRRVAHTGTAGTPVKIPPPWMRILIIDPVTQDPAPAGVPGLVRIWDLSNRGSAVAIQTEDIGVREGNGYRILGRAIGADPRGCSRAVDEMLSN